MQFLVLLIPKIGQYPAASILKAVAKKSPDRIKDETLILADHAEKAWAGPRQAI